MVTNSKKVIALLVFSCLTLVSPQSDRNIERVDGVKSIELLNDEAKLLEEKLNEIVNNLEQLNN